MTAATARRHAALIIGAGSIGLRHARNLIALGVADVTLVDQDVERARAAAASLGARHASTLDEGLAGRPTIVLVCTPPASHVEQAVRALDAGAHVFIEKPLSDRLAGLDELERCAAASGLVVQVGYNLRFVPAIQILKDHVARGSIGRVLWIQSEFGQYLPDWRPSQDYRRSYTAQRSLGGGIILDASHEIDYVLWLMGPPTIVRALAGKVSDLELDVEDCATILLRFDSGAQGDIHLDCVQRGYRRGCRLIGETGTLEWSAADGTRLYRAADRQWVGLTADWDRDAMYVAELEHFLECIDRGAAPLSNLATARLTLEVAIAARDSAP